MRRVAVATVSAVVLVLAGCTSDGNDGDKAKRAPNATGSASASSASSSGSVLVQPTDLPTKVANSPALRKAVTVTTCAKAKNGWQARGTATNTRKAKFTYALTVYFTTPTATVIGFGRTRVSVGADGSEKWTVKAKFPAVKNTKCVLTGVGKG